jgi:hypothetical protein
VADSFDHGNEKAQILNGKGGPYIRSGGDEDRNPKVETVVPHFTDNYRYRRPLNCFGPVIPMYVWHLCLEEVLFKMF